jgi:CheY-like chemotaxis protein
MNAGEIDLDLDFTRFIPVPASLRTLAPTVAPPIAVRPPVVAPAAAAPPARLVCYARRPERVLAAAPDAPVLVVEDHEPSRRLLAALLKKQGYAVRTAGDSRECVRELRMPPLPRLILLDIGLPRISGLDILGHLRKQPQTALIPVVMVTASATDDDLTRGLALGVEGFLSKPISVKSLQSILETVLWKP